MSDNGVPNLVDPLEGNNPEELPGWGRTAISKANNQAAKFRTDLVSVTEAHTSALGQISKLTDDKSTAEKERDGAVLQHKKLLIALEAGVPGAQAVSIAARLQGATEDEIKADAQKLVTDFGLGNVVPATDPSQGRGGDGTSGTATNQLSAGAAAFRKLVEGQLAS